MGKNTQKHAVIVFAKYPDDGNVKTRLAKTTGDKFATEFYKLCAQHTFRELNNLPEKTIKIYLFFVEGIDNEKIKSWVDYNFLFRPQSGKNLGEKMYNAFTEIFENGFERVVIIGTDLPDISSGIIMEAFAALENNDAVIGPSTDGGYYLLGIKSPKEELFSKIDWSTESVYQQTLDKLLNANMEVKTLTELVDIDTEEDLIDWLSNKKENKENKLYLKITSIYTP
ncbi:MAG: TIGR04282 family arsenosugar biosynthesis glycosyltransferase [Ignavibacteriaceae bacterium]